MPDNEIDSIIADAEWWMETLKHDYQIDPNAMHDFVTFCYRFMPALLAEIKRLQTPSIDGT